jgi:hypothetical protein
MNSASELWYVQLSDGDVHRVTLDQLDEGFQAGHIGASTMVLAAGATRWSKLGDLAGIDDVASSFPAPRTLPPPVLAPPVLSTPYAPPPRFLESHRPVSVDLSDLEVVPGPPHRSRKRWLMALVGVAMLGGIAGVGVERPGLLALFMKGVGTRASVAKSWILTDVPRRLFGKPPSGLQMSPPSTAVASVSLAPSTLPPPPPEPLPTAQNAALGASLAASFIAPAADSPGTKPPARGGVPKARARKIHAKGASSSDSSTRAPSAFTTSGSKFDPLSSNIQ